VIECQPAEGEVQNVTIVLVQRPPTLDGFESGCFYGLRQSRRRGVDLICHAVDQRSPAASSTSMVGEDVSDGDEEPPDRRIVVRWKQIETSPSRQVHIGQDVIDLVLLHSLASEVETYPRTLGPQGIYPLDTSPTGRDR